MENNDVTFKDAYDKLITGLELSSEEFDKLCDEVNLEYIYMSKVSEEYGVKFEKLDNIGGRQVAFKALVGSHNYNLNTPESDRDYKLFVIPTFNDLYFNKSYSKMRVGDEEDIDIHDIRKCSSLWCKANVSFLEVLFSNEIIINENLEYDTMKRLLLILELRYEIAKMNLKYLYDACFGMHLNKMKYLEKGTSGTKHLVDKYGYDTKQAQHAYRILDFLERFANTNYGDFKKAIWYEPNEKGLLMEIKNGMYDIEYFKNIVERKIQRIREMYKEGYVSKHLIEDTNDQLIKYIKEIIKEEIKKEISNE